MNTPVSESRTRKEIAVEFRKWKVREYDFPASSNIGEKTAKVRFVLRDKPIEISCSSQREYKDNLRCIYIAVWAMRMNEKRGIADTMQQAYLQLAAPEMERDPYEVLGVRPDAPLEVIEASHKALAKSHHPDVGGSDEAMKELNSALEKIKFERKL